MLLVAINDIAPKVIALVPLKNGHGCIGRDAKSSVPDANIGLHVEVCVVVFREENAKLEIRHQSSPETVSSPMLQSIDVTNVVAVFANVNCSVDGRPELRFIGRVDLIALELPRENLRVGPAVISKLENQY